MFKKSLKGLTVVLCVVSFLLGNVFASSTVRSITATINEAQGMFINGYKVEYKEPDGTVLFPINYNGRIYVPIRAIAQGLGYPLEWGSNTYAFLQVPKYYQIGGKGAKMFFDFHDAVILKREPKVGSMAVFIDKTKLTPQLQDYKYVCVIPDKTFDLDKDVARLYTKDFEAWTKQRDDSRVFFTDQVPATIVLYNSEKEPIGVTKIEASDKNVVTLSGYDSSLIEVTSGITSKMMSNGFKSLFIDSSKLPAAVKDYTYIAGVNGIKSSQDAINLAIQFNAMGEGIHDVREYNPDWGYGVSSFPVTLYFLNSSKKVIGYALVLQ